MKRYPESMEKAFKKISKEHARLIRKIWKEGCERAAQSVLEARRLDKDNLKPRLRKSR